MARSPLHKDQYMRFDIVLYELTSGFQDLTRALSAIRQRQRDNLVESREFDLCIKPVSQCRVKL